MSTTPNTNNFAPAFSKSGTNNLPFGAPARGTEEMDKDSLECRETFYYNNIYNKININENEKNLKKIFIEGLIKYHKDENIELDFDFEGEYDNGWASECMFCVLDSWISYDKNNKYRYLIKKLEADPQFSDDFLWDIVHEAMFEIEDPLLRKET